MVVELTNQKNLIELIHIYKIKCGKVYLAVLLRARIFVVLLGDRQHRSLNYLLNIKIKHLWLITN